MTAALGARAVTKGNDVFFARNSYVPESVKGRALLGHELAHVVQQKRVGVAAFQCTPDPLVAGFTPSVVEAFTDAELRAAETTLIEALNSGTAVDTLVAGMEGNLALIQSELRGRGLAVTPHTGLRLTSDTSKRVDANQLLTLQTRFDLAIAMARSQLPRGSGNLVRRLEADRARLSYLHVDALEETANKIGTLLVGIAHLGPIARVVNGGRPSNHEVTVALEALATELASATSLLGTAGQDAAITAVDDASREYTSAITRALITTAMTLRDEINSIRAQETRSEDPVPPLRSDNQFIGGYARGNRIQFGESSRAFAAYRDEREEIESEFAGLEQLNAMADAPLEERLAFLQGEGAGLLELVRRGQGLLMLHSGIALGNALMHATTQATDAIQWTDVALATRLVEQVVRPLGAALESGQIPSDSVIANAQRTLRHSSGEVSDRLVEVQTHLRRFGYFVQFSTLVLSLFTGMAAMRLATGGASLTQMTLGQFVRGSLAFTAGSYSTNIALTDAEFDIGDLAVQAGVDMATLGLMRFVGVGLAARYPRGAVPPAVMASSQFATLWAWSTTVSAAGRLLDDDPDNNPNSVADALSLGGDSLVHTAEAFVALAIAHKLATVPVVTAAAGESNAARAAIAEITRLAEVGRQLEADVQRWMQSGESRAELEVLMRRAEGWYGEYRRGLRGLVEAEVIDVAASTHLSDAIGPDIAQIRNVSDAARLGLRQTGRLTTAYSGGVRNFDLYLSRLKRQNLITDYSPQGRTGVYEVRYPDNTRGYFYPEARDAGSGIPNFAAETIEAQFPNIPQAARARALENLGRLPAGEATRIIGELRGENGRVLADFLGDPETSALMAQEGSFLTAEVIRGIARDAELRSLVETEGGRLQHWHDTSFESVVGGRGSFNLVRFVAFVRQYRGTLEVSSATEAQAIVDQLATTTEAIPFSPRTYRQGPSIGRPGSAAPFDPSTWMAEHANGRTLGGTFQSVGNETGTTFVQFLRGKPARAWRFSRGSETPVEVDVRAHLRAIEQGLENAESMPDAGTRQATLDSLRFHADALAFLRGIRGVDLAEVNALLERVAPRPAAPVREVGRIALVEPVQTAELVPLTRGEATRSRRRALLDRATRMGEIQDPVVAAIARWNPRVRATVPADPAATLDAVEARLNQLAEGATRRAARRLGRTEYGRLRTGAFEGRTDIGDILHLTRNLEGMTPKALRGLAYAAQSAPGGRPIPIERIFELTRNNAADRTLVLEAFAEAVEFRHSDGTPIEGVYRMLREMTHSRNNWRGGTWVFRDIVTEGGPTFADVAAFEAVETRTEMVDGVERVLERRYDVRLRDGQHLEYKSWTRWFPSSIRRQFGRDVRIQTQNFADLAQLDQIRWRFERRPLLQEGRGADTRSREMTETEAFEAIRTEMLTGLRTAMTEAGIVDPARRTAIEGEFQSRAKAIIFVGGGQP